MACQQLAAALDPVGADHAAAILGEGHPALGLAPIGLDHRRDRAHAGERGVEHRRVDPAARAPRGAGSASHAAKESAAASERRRRQRQGTGRARPSAVRRSDGPHVRRLAPHQHERNRMNRRDGAQPEEEIVRRRRPRSGHSVDQRDVAYLAGALDRASRRRRWDLPGGVERALGEHGKRRAAGRTTAEAWSPDLPAPTAPPQAATTWTVTVSEPRAWPARAGSTVEPISTVAAVAIVPTARRGLCAHRFLRSGSRTLQRTDTSAWNGSARCGGARAGASAYAGPAQKVSVTCRLSRYSPASTAGLGRHVAVDGEPARRAAVAAAGDRACRPTRRRPRGPSGRRRRTAE